jgi:DMSO/TMAO reductase YedYZ molybdopterin-dependent catalytic subunit
MAVARDAAAGVVAAGVAIAGMMGFGLLTGQATLAEGVAEAIAGIVPLGLIEFMILKLGPAAKHVLFLSALGGIASAGVALAAVAAARGWGRARVAQWVVGLAALAGVILCIAVAASIFGAPSLARTTSLVISLAITTAIYLLLLLALTGRLVRTPDEVELLDDPRRAFIKNTLLGLGGIVVVGTFTRWIAESAASPRATVAQSLEPATPLDTDQSTALVQALADGVPGIPPEITPTDKHYYVSKNVIRDPDVNERNWRLQIKGLVDRPMSFTYDEIRNMPALTQYLTLQCISNEIGGDLISTAKWRGVPVADLLQRAGVREGAFDLILRSADDYTDSIPIAKALQPDTMLAYEMNDQVLPKKHGFPLRLLVPDIYGMKNAKWVTELEVVEYDFKGYWQNRGWSDTAVMHVTSRIDAPRNNNRLSTGANYIGGVAVAGQRGIQRVEVSIDGGQSWREAAIKPALGPNTWVLWLYQWDTPQGLTGDRQILVRAVDGNGLVQDGVRRDTLPDGASGYHAITVRMG